MTKDMPHLFKYDIAGTSYGIDVNLESKQI